MNEVNSISCLGGKGVQRISVPPDTFSWQMDFPLTQGSNKTLIVEWILDLMNKYTKLQTYTFFEFSPFTLSIQ